jgi:hypothetical protein
MNIEALLQPSKVLSATNINEACTVKLKSVIGRSLSKGHSDKVHGSTEILEFLVFKDNAQIRIRTYPFILFNSIQLSTGIGWMLGASNYYEDTACDEPLDCSYVIHEISILSVFYKSRVVKAFSGINLTRGVISAQYCITNFRSGIPVIWSPENAVRAFQVIHLNCSSDPKRILHYPQFISNKLEVTPPKNVAKLNKNVSEYLHRFIGLKPPLWLSDLCTPQIIVSALFLILLKSVLHQSLLYKVWITINLFKLSIVK